MFTDDREIHRLNRDYRGKDKPTDVLSFPQLEDAGTRLTAFPGAARSLGDLVISIPTARRQAIEYKHSFEREMLRLCVHGILHLMGYDHENVSAAEARRMVKTEDAVLDSLSAGIALDKLSFRA